MDTQILTPGQAGYGSARDFMTRCDNGWKKAINAGTLRHEDYVGIQEQITQVRRHALVVVNDFLTTPGMTVNTDIINQVYGYEAINEFSAAQVSMNPIATNTNQTTYTPAYIPVPIIKSSFGIPFRQKNAPYKRSDSVDESSYQIAYKMESIAMTGDSGAVVTGPDSTQVTLTGLENAANKQTFTITDWTDIATNGATIIPELLTGLSGLFNTTRASVPNSIMVYLPLAFWLPLQNDISSTAPGVSYLDKMKSLSMVKDVKVAPQLTAGDVLLVEMLPRTCQLVIASNIIMAPHVDVDPYAAMTMSGMASMAMLVKSDINSLTGISLGSV